MTAHPFELAGMGLGPFSFVGVYEMPTPGDGSAAMFANPNPYADAPRLVSGLGTCSNCGMAIRNVCIIRNAAGELYGVGSDCVEKTGDPALGDAAKVAVARITRRKRQAAAEAKRQRDHIIWMGQISRAADALPAETNQARRDRLDAEIASDEAERAQRALFIGAKFARFADVLADGRGGFRDSIARDLRNGNVPRGRGLDIAVEIYSKAFGRTGSKTAQAAALDFLSTVAPEQN